MNGIYIITDNLTFEVASNDLPSTYDWIEAQLACASLNDRWRLPSLKELQYMYHLHKKALGNFKLESYWTSDGVNNFDAYCLNFLNGGTASGVGSIRPAPKYFVRPVRTV
jgi:hypothetical protein